MKALTSILFVLTLTSYSYGQQDPMLSQYMFNGLYLNPAYAGSHDYWSSTLSYRTQWVGAEFEGAPETAIAAVDGPIRGQNMGLGVLFFHDRIGVVQQNCAQVSYAYQLVFKNKSRLALGVSGGFAQFNANLSDLLVWDGNDKVYASNTSLFVPKAGVGVYYYGKRFYAGAAIPTLIAYQEDNNFALDVSESSFIRRHYTFTTGVVLDAGKVVKFKPSVLLKYVENAPFQADLNLSAVFKEMFWIGASYRTNDAVVGIVEFQTKGLFRFGYSYDFTVSELRNYQNGSHEIMVGIDFGKDLVKVKSPRYF